MSPREANLLTAFLLFGLAAGLSFTAPRWARFLRQPVATIEEEGSGSGIAEARGAEGEVQRTISVKLYFPSPDQPGLLAEERSVTASADLSRQLRVVVEELVRGSRTGLLQPLAGQTRVLEVFVNARGVAYVDLSKEALELPAAGSDTELLAVYSIVNSITANFPAVKRVQILVDDKPVDTLAGHVDLSRPLLSDMTYLVQVAPQASPAPQAAPPASPPPEKRP